MMVKLNKIYTKTGDEGLTGLTDGSRIKKHHVRTSAYGTVDELNSILGIIVNLLHQKKNNELKLLLNKIQNDLFDLGADLSTPYSNEDNFKSLRIVEKQINNLEKLIDKFNKNLNPLNSFILPGGSEIAAWLHLARTVARRAERDTSKLSEKEKINKFSLIYLNRLSDLLFVISRFANNNGKKDVLWIPGKNQ